MVFGIAVSVFSIYSHMAVGIVGMVNGVAVPACSTVFLSKFSHANHAYLSGEITKLVVAK